MDVTWMFRQVTGCGYGNGLRLAYSNLSVRLGLKGNTMLTEILTKSDVMMWVSLNCIEEKGKEKEMKWKGKERKGQRGGGAEGGMRGYDGVQTPEPSSCCCFVGQHYISRFMENAGNHFST